MAYIILHLMHWIPLESNPEVLNDWAKKAGLITSQTCFIDVYGLEKDLLSMIPQPVKAVILLFPVTNERETQRREEDEAIKKNGQYPVDHTLIYITQTIGNACGAIGLLHAVINSGVPIGPDTPLHHFIDQCQQLSSQQRGELLENSDIFTSIHLDAARQGQTEAPAADANVDLHFTCFVPSPDPSKRGSSRLVELDGSRSGPIDCGPCNDFLSDVATYIKEKYIGTAADLHFTMVALAPPLD